MGNYKTSDELQVEFIEILGEELGQLYFELYREVTLIHLKWAQFSHLFAEEENVETLNNAAPLFFWIAQNALHDDIVLHLSRITDPPKTMNRDNHSLQRLPELILDGSLRADVQEAVDDVVTSCASLRLWRNRRIAHSDLLTFRGEHPTPLPALDKSVIDGACKAIGELVNLIHGYYWRSEVVFKALNGPEGTKALLYYLERGLKTGTVT